MMTSHSIFITRLIYHLPDFLFHVARGVLHGAFLCHPPPFPEDSDDAHDSRHSHLTAPNDELNRFLLPHFLPDKSPAACIVSLNFVATSQIALFEVVKIHH